MIRTDKFLEEHTGILYNELKNKEYGEKLSWENLRKLANLDRSVDMDTLYYIANKCCIMLMANDKKYLKTIFGYGKMIIEPNQHIGESKRKVKQSVKKYIIAGKILNATNMEMLSLEEQKEVIEKANKFSTLKMFTEEILLERKTLPDKRKSKDMRRTELISDIVTLLTDDKKDNTA